MVCGELNVSAKVAGALIKEYRTLCGARQFGDDVFSISCGGGPAVAYDRMMRRTLLMQRSGEGVQGRTAETEKGLVWRDLQPVAIRTKDHPRRQSGSGAGDGAAHNAAEDMVG